MNQQGPIDYRSTPAQKYTPRPMGSPYPTDPLIEAVCPKLPSELDKMMQSPAKLVLSSKMNKDNRFEYVELNDKDTDVTRKSEEQRRQERRRKILQGWDETDLDDERNKTPTLEQELDMIAVSPELVGLCLCIVGFLGFLCCIVVKK